MSVGIERIASQLVPRDGGADGRFRERLAAWEDLLTLVVDPASPRVEDRERKRRMLSFLLEQSRIEEDTFWKLSRGQRGRLFLSRWSRVSRDIPRLEITSFDIDKVFKERFRKEPLTIGSAWATYQARRITRPVGTLVRGTNEIARGRLEHQIPVRGGSELRQLAGAFNQMTKSVQALIETSRQLSSTLDLDAVLHSVGAYALELVKADIAAIATYDREQQEAQ